SAARHQRRVDHLPRGVAGEGHQERRARRRGGGAERRQRAHQDCARGRGGTGRRAGGGAGRTRARVIRGGAYGPQRILTNRDLEKLVDTSDEWIVQRTGIRERHVVGEGEATSDLALKAAEQAMERAGVTAEEIDLIVVGTTTGDSAFPTTANILQ